MYRARSSNFRFSKNNNKNNVNRKRNISRRKIFSMYSNQLRSYLWGLLHPEEAVTGGYIPKAPNYVSIPTSNITFREAFDIEPDKNGEFTLYWTPNFLATKDSIEYRTQGLYSNYSHNWLGGFDNGIQEYTYTPIASYLPPASFTKYRLVSAGIKITYKGAVLDRAGIISHCLSYRSFPVVYFDPEANNLIPANDISLISELGKSINNISATSVQNGMWNGVQNIQKNNTVFCVAVPTDPSDFIFEDDGYFYSAATASEYLKEFTHNFTTSGGDNLIFKCVPQLPEDGTPCTYIFKGTDLAVDNKLYVEQYYNFEVIPTEESAPILRPRLNDVSTETMEKSKELVNKILSKSGGSIGTNTKIDQLLKADSQFLDDTNISLIPQNESNSNLLGNSFWSQPPSNIYKKPVIKQKTSFGTKVKNFAKNTAKKVFTKDNAKFAMELAGALLAGAAGKK